MLRKVSQTSQENFLFGIFDPNSHTPEISIDNMLEISTSNNKVAKDIIVLQIKNFTNTTFCAWKLQSSILSLIFFQNGTQVSKISVGFFRSLTVL